MRPAPGWSPTLLSVYASSQYDDEQPVLVRVRLDPVRLVLTNPKLYAVFSDVS